MFERLVQRSGKGFDDRIAVGSWSEDGGDVGEDDGVGRGKRDIERWETLVLDGFLGFLVEIGCDGCVLVGDRLWDRVRGGKLRNAVNNDLSWRCTEGKRVTVPNDDV